MSTGPLIPARGVVGRRRCGLAVIAVLFLACPALGQSQPAEEEAFAKVDTSGSGYPREEIHDQFVGGDEAVTDLRLANSRWPDCHSNASAIADIFRLEGVTDKNDQAKALALWKWFRILVSSTCGGYCYEADEKGRPQIVFDGHKIFTVYGHHQCDGLSWAMVPLWRAAGYIAFDECHHGHTIASLRYLDQDGHWRFHDLDPQSRAYYWDEGRGIIGTWSMPLMRGLVHRHLLHPQRVHTLRRPLRLGETVEWKWDNEGYVIPVGKQGRKLTIPQEYQHQPGRKDGVYAAVGQETQVFVVPAAPDQYASALFEGSLNTAGSPPAEGKATLHPAGKGAPANFVYRLPSAYVAVDAEVEATLVKSAEADACRLSLSLDRGKTWNAILTKDKTGTEKVAVNIGRQAREEDRPNVYSYYEFLIRAEFSTSGDPRGVGMNDLKITARRQCNKRTLPNLMPGRNVFRVSGQLKQGHTLGLTLRYRINGQETSKGYYVASLPFYLEIDTGPVEDKPLRNYDQAFNVGAIQMDSIAFAAGPARRSVPDKSLPPEQAEAEFHKPFPHPADMTSRQIVKKPETDPMQTSGFLPQSKEVRRDKEAMDALIRTLRTGGDVQRWVAAEDLGNYPEAIDALLEAWPKANIDLTLHLCKALAQIKDPRAIEPVLKRWAEVPKGAPGTRYIPDVLAAIGDRRVVPQLVAPLKRLRFDYRFHIVHALGILGGSEAEAALADVARNDPLPGVKQCAAECLGLLVRRRGR